MDIRAIIMGLAFAVMWSSAFTSARIIVADAPPMTALAIRFVISGLLAIGIARMMGQRIKLTRAQWISVVVFGVCQNALYLGLNFIAMQTIEAGFASIIASTMPLIVGLLGWIVFRDRLPLLAVVGLVVGFAGVALIMGSRISGGVDMYGLILCVIAAVALAVATLSVRTASGGGNLLMVVGLQMLVGSIALAPFAVAMEPWEVNWNPGLIAAFIYTTLVPGLAATWVWFELVHRIGAVRAATFHFLNPFFGVAIAAVLLGEQLGLLDVIGVAVVTVGILAVQLSKQKPAPVTADRAAT
ncbi:DMT family transporter [Maritimibacter sp. UBA3975]|uniref:DMT family transporter n=1 Tax=Maritimibacter sp. UBA3975 TaxID=1946833 RepID=UPI000C0B5E8C|nr:DMT family transporter [Maritimibacter sp. UBA3975]MAM63297.1 EamA family transporter [Maritimibacter sp.]|tara:strand:- start:47205 stop:48101 length:897 start_codon:yes stop_codon:yes gene_type:complete